MKYSKFTRHKRRVFSKKKSVARTYFHIASLKKKTSIYLQPVVSYRVMRIRDLYRGGVINN